MKTVARIVLGIFVGVPAGTAVGSLIAALVGVMLCGASIIGAADGALDAIGGFLVFGLMFGILVTPTASAAGGFGGIIGPFSSNHRELFLVSAGLVGAMIGLLRLLTYLGIQGNLRPDMLEVLLHPMAGVISGLTSAIVARRTVAMVERRGNVS